MRQLRCPDGRRPALLPRVRGTARAGSLHGPGRRDLDPDGDRDPRRPRRRPLVSRRDADRGRGDAAAGPGHRRPDRPRGQFGLVGQRRQGVSGHRQRRGRDRCRGCDDREARRRPPPTRTPAPAPTRLTKPSRARGRRPTPRRPRPRPSQRFRRRPSPWAPREAAPVTSTATSPATSSAVGASGAQSVQRRIGPASRARVRVPRPQPSPGDRRRLRASRRAIHPAGV